MKTLTNPTLGISPLYNGNIAETMWRSSSDNIKRSYGYQYDASIGRFHNMDRFSEKYADTTPYHYAANNPIRFIDIKGDSIYVNVKGVNYKYEGGKVYKIIDGKYSSKEAEKIDEGSDLELIVNTLNTIASDKEVGKKMINYFSGEKNVFINYSADAEQNSTIGRKITLNPTLNRSVITQSGKIKMSFYLSTFHELSHAWSFYEIPKDIRLKKWYSNEGGGDVVQDEIIASHWENLLRSSMGIDLRTHYSYSVDESGNVSEMQGKLLENGKALYINQAGPSIINTDNKNNIISITNENNRYSY